MGLDMYLTKEHYVKNWDFMKPEERTKVTVLKGGKPHPAINTERVSGVTEEVAYWRKANAIHKWFVDNVQDGKDECQRSYVDLEQLKELVSLCKKILDIKDPEKQKRTAEKLLPPQAGFFFGSTEIDQYYLEDLQNTIDQIQPELEKEPTADYYYRASW